MVKEMDLGKVLYLDVEFVVTDLGNNACLCTLK